MRNFIDPMKGVICTSVIALTVLSAPVFAAIENLSYLDFRTNGIFVTNSTGNSGSIEVSWNPSYELNSDWSVRGLVGAASLKGEDGTLMMTEYGVMGAYDFMPTWEVELGAGIQSWSGQETSPMIATNVLKTLEAPLLGYVDRVFAGFSQVSHEESTSVFKVGVTATFGAK